MRGRFRPEALFNSAADQSLISAKFTQMRLSQGDDSHVDVIKTDDGWKVNIRANTLDARPFLRNLTFNKSDDEDADADSETMTPQKMRSPTRISRSTSRPIRSSATTRPRSQAPISI